MLACSSSLRHFFGRLILPIDDPDPEIADRCNRPLVESFAERKSDRKAIQSLSILTGHKQLAKQPNYHLSACAVMLIALPVGHPQ